MKVNEKAAARGGELFESGLFCAESVLKTVAEQARLESALVPGIATGLCGGMARTGGTCGALTGGMLAIGMLRGRHSAEDSVEETYALVQKLNQEFETRFGGTNCTGLLGCDLGTTQGREQFKQDNLGERCREFTAVAAGLVMELLDEAPEVVSTLSAPGDGEK